MDQLTRYRQIARAVIEGYARHRVSHGRIESEAVIDPARDHYELMQVGWDGPRRVHGSVVHFDIIDGKFWVQYDGTDRPVVDELEEAGVPKDDIVLAFQPVERRPHTGYAVG